MDLRGAFTNKDDAPGRELVDRQLAKAASLLRDLVYTAWIESGKPLPAAIGSPNDPSVPTNALSPKNPNFNPATGNAAPGKPVPNH